MHPYFKTLVPAVDDANKIHEMMGIKLKRQGRYTQCIAPCERSVFRDNGLQNIKVNVDEIDRLYFISKKELIARIDYNGTHVYVMLDNKCYIMFISQNANLFMNLVLPLKYAEYHKHLIYKSLANDHIYVEDMEEGDSEFLRKFKKEVPSLKFMCHETSIRSMKREYYKMVLPKILTDSLDNFKDIAVARDDLNTCLNDPFNLG